VITDLVGCETKHLVNNWFNEIMRDFGELLISVIYFSDLDINFIQNSILAYYVRTCARVSMVCVILSILEVLLLYTLDTFVYIDSEKISHFSIIKYIEPKNNYGH
jgi:hypothetical protein